MKIDLFNKILKKSKTSKKILILENNTTYKDFFKNTFEIFDFLKLRVKKKEVICVCSGYSLDFISLIFASYLNDNTITFVNPNASESEKKHVIKDSKASLIIFEKNYLNLKKKINNFKRFKFIQLKRGFKCNARFIIYTSGTTNKAKGVLISNLAISSNIISIMKNLKLKKNDKGIIFSPPAYAMGISQILTLMYAECSLNLYNQGIKFPRELINKIKKYDISILNLSISAFRILHNYLNKNEKFNKIRLVMSGGMQYNQEDLKLFKRHFPKSKFLNFYGCTENSPRISHYAINSNKNFNGFFPVGRALDGVKIKIKKNNDANQLFGEVLISGNSLMSGYLNLKNLSRSKLKNGWFNTGDLGFFNKRGELYLIGRSDNTFRVGHEKLFPEEIESFIKKNLKIREVIISKIKDKILNWVPICIIEKQNEKKISKEKIISKLQKNFSSYKIPKKIIFIKKIPKTNYGKIDRMRMRNII